MAKFDTNKLLDDTSITEVASMLGYRAVRGKMLCIAHNDKEPSMVLYEKDKRYKCFACGASGRTLDFISKVCGLSFEDSCEWLIKNYGLNRSNYTQEKERKPKKAREYQHMSAEELNLIGITNQPVRVITGILPEDAYKGENNSKYTVEREDTYCTKKELLLRNPLQDLFESDPAAYEFLVNSRAAEKKRKTAIKDELAEAIESNDRQIANLSKSVQLATDKVASLEGEKRTLMQEQIKYEKYLNALNTIDSLKKSIPNIPEKVEEDKTDITALEFDNRVIKQKIEDIRKYDEFKKNEQTYLNLCKKRDLCDAIVKLLDEKGSLREQILTLALKPFEDYANDRAKTLGIAYNLKIVANKGVRILYNPNGGTEYISYNNASTGEKLIISFLILDMINALSDLRLLFIDNLDKLDRDALDKLVTLLNEPTVQNAYDHIFMVGVDHQDVTDTVGKLSGVYNISI